jgi:hypothetical protein
VWPTLTDGPGRSVHTPGLLLEHSGTFGDVVHKGCDGGFLARDINKSYTSTVTKRMLTKPNDSLIASKSTTDVSSDVDMVTPPFVFGTKRLPFHVSSSERQDQGTVCSKDTSHLLQVLLSNPSSMP